MKIFRLKLRADGMMAATMICLALAAIQSLAQSTYMKPKQNHGDRWSRI